MTEQQRPDADEGQDDVAGHLQPGFADDAGAADDFDRRTRRRFADPDDGDDVTGHGLNPRDPKR